MEASQIYQSVSEHYSKASKAVDREYGHTVAKAFGYSEEELLEIPEDANLGLSCGNPMVIAKLREGETVVDLGCGAGFDVFLAAKNVGPSGRVIGIDMNKDMLDRANQQKEKSKVENVTFLESQITKINLSNSIADCIISNCVINLVPDQEKQLAFNEMFRLLKSGGRIAISDILAKKDFPDSLKEDMALYVGCIAGASKTTEYESYLKTAGFKDIMIVDSNHDLNVYKQPGTSNIPCCGSGPAPAAKPKSKTPCCCKKAKETRTDEVDSSSDIDYNDWAGSFKIYAVKA